MKVQQNHPKSFFKYMPASTAEKVLKNRTLRWSHPSEFDDTLDVAQVCDEKMDSNKQKQIHDAIIDLAAIIPVNCDINKTREIFIKIASSLSLCPDKTSTIFELKNGSINISNIVDDINECWKKEIRNDLRILCLGIEKDNPRLWNDYAEKHKGAVIELACREESDSPWRIAKPVEYVNEKDLFLTVGDWADIISLKDIVAAHYIMEKCCLRKAKDNENKWYEQNEWRISSFCRHYETGTVSDYGVNPKDFSAVYFGHKMDSETIDNLLGLLVGELGHVFAFRCELNSSQDMSFKKLK